LGETYKRLGAVDVISANTNTVLYTVPSGKSAVVGSINVCNRGGNAIKFRLAHVDGGLGALANEDYVYFGLSVAAGDTFEATRGITMAAGDTLVVFSDRTTVNFIAWGCEVDIV
jgi:hypothetical protein